MNNKWIAIFIVFYASLSSCGTHGRIKGYEFSTSKNKVNRAIKIFYTIYPNFLIPERDRQKLWHYEPYSSDTNKVSAYARVANSDSVSFYFYDTNSKILYWSFFENHNDDWMKNNCTLGLVSIFEPKKIEKFDADLTSTEKELYLKNFELRVISKIDSVLAHSN